MTFVPDYALDSLEVTYGKPTVACPLKALHTHTHTRVNTLKLICPEYVFTASKIEFGAAVWATVLTLRAHTYGIHVMLFSSNDIACGRV